MAEPSNSRSMTRYTEALHYLAEFADLERGGGGRIRLGLERTRELLGALGHPEERFPSVLIAGTKGKGSTAAMVERALRAAGYRTGLYTQPHLHTIRERIRIDGAPVSEEDFAHTMEVVRAAANHKPDASGVTTAYEVMTALAIAHFAEQHVEFGVLEVGLGGRLDATNVVPARASAITSISLDHTQVLGNTLDAIAKEKADIIKPERPCVSAPQPAEAMRVIRHVASERGAPLRIACEDGARWESVLGNWSLVTEKGRIEAVRPALRGGFQRINIAVAATLLDALADAGLERVTLDAVRTGIEDVDWPGRFDVQPGHPTVVLDGAHNVESAQRLREAVDEAFGTRGILFVVGIFTDKDVPGIVAALLAGQPASDGRVGATRPETHAGLAGGAGAQRTGQASMLVATRSAHPRAADPEAIVGIARAAGVDATSAPTVAAALEVASERASRDDVIVVTGSLSVVAEAREALGIARSSGEPAFNPWAAR